MKLFLIIFSLFCAANLAHADLNKGRERKQNYVDEEKWQEQQVVLPTFANMDWVELYKPESVKPRIFIDRNTLLLAEDRTVRYTLLQLSTTGTENISREGIHCGERIHRSYAFGDIINHRWIESQRSEWRKIERSSELMKLLAQALCPSNTPPLSSEELFSNLETASITSEQKKIEPIRK